MGSAHGKNTNLQPCCLVRTPLRRTARDDSARPWVAGGSPRHGHGKRARRLLHVAVTGARRTGPSPSPWRLACSDGLASTGKCSARRSHRGRLHPYSRSGPLATRRHRTCRRTRTRGTGTAKNYAPRNLLGVPDGSFQAPKWTPRIRTRQRRSPCRQGRPDASSLSRVWRVRTTVPNTARRSGRRSTARRRCI